MQLYVLFTEVVVTKQSQEGLFVNIAHMLSHEQKIFEFENGNNFICSNLFEYCKADGFKY